jgi:hypothetical protein
MVGAIDGDEDGWILFVLPTLLPRQGRSTPILYSSPCCALVEPLEGVKNRNSVAGSPSHYTSQAVTGHYQSCHGGEAFVFLRSWVPFWWTESRGDSVVG